MNVNLFKANLGEYGCEEAQLDVAKRLLKDSTDPGFSERGRSKFWMNLTSYNCNLYTKCNVIVIF